MKLLNLDKLSKKAERKVSIGGVEYDVHPVTVGMFVNMSKEAGQYINAGVFDPLQEVEMIFDLISQSIPDAPRGLIESLEVEQLKAIADFIRDGDVAGAEDVEGND